MQKLKTFTAFAQIYALIFVSIITISFLYIARYSFYPLQTNLDQHNFNQAKITANNLVPQIISGYKDGKYQDNTLYTLTIKNVNLYFKLSKTNDNQTLLDISSRIKNLLSTNENRYSKRILITISKKP